MGPSTNPELYSVAAAKLEVHLDDEHNRRIMVAPYVAELAELFGAKDNTPNVVVEPTLVSRLIALSMVQRSRMGVTGLEPLEAFDYDGTAQAHAAPAHDEFITSKGHALKTRAVNFVLPGRSNNNDIAIFGLNVYQPSADDDPAPVKPTETSHQGFVVVDKKGTARGQHRPITGETVVFAVYNKSTKDAKVYTVALEDPKEDVLHYTDRSVSFESETQAVVTMRDNRRVTVTQLTGDILMQAVRELDAATKVLSGKADLKDLLSEEETVAARITAASSDNSID